jgi:hypothetical protein
LPQPLIELGHGLVTENVVPAAGGFGDVRDDESKIRCVVRQRQIARTVAQVAVWPTSQSSVEGWGNKPL